MRHDLLFPGISLAFEGGFFGLSTVALLRVDGHPPILFDCGHHVTRGPLLAALAAHSLSPDEIGTLVLSHLHFDHAENIELFGAAEIVLSCVEWDYAAHPHCDDPHVASAIRARMTGRQVRLIEGETEIAPGLRLFPTPGHTPGHMALAYVANDGARVTLAADAVKTAREAMSGVPDMEFDPERRGGDTIRRVLDESDIIVPGHHPELRRTASGWTWDSPASLTLVVR